MTNPNVVHLTNPFLAAPAAAAPTLTAAQKALAWDKLVGIAAAGLPINQATLARTVDEITAASTTDAAAALAAARPDQRRTAIANYFGFASPAA